MNKIVTCEFITGKVKDVFPLLGDKQMKFIEPYMVNDKHPTERVYFAARYCEEGFTDPTLRLVCDVVYKNGRREPYSFSWSKEAECSFIRVELVLETFDSNI